MLNFLYNSTRPDISYAVHQCVIFSENPKNSHEKAVKQIIKYLEGTKHDGLFFTPRISKGLECYVDSDFAGSWNKIDCEDRASVVL